MDFFPQKFQHLKIQLEEIKAATRNFDNNNIIGKGGFGKVYEGVLSHSKGQSMVAFKRLDRNYGQGDPEFLKEILMLSGYKHVNLISLLGFCDQDGEKILVYEHASHGSLDRHLSSTALTWRNRLKICLGAAMGLCYLHDPQETQQRVLHRDIKSSNILLDENWNAKVSDMGLSKLGPANQQHTFVVSNVVGTFGYVDPMYMETSILTKESDVFSLGVVLFEVLCGRLCNEYNNGHLQSLVRMWKQCYKQNKLAEIIFRDMRQNMDPSSLETFSDIAYRCLRKSREERPKMSEVVEKLEIALRYQEIFEEGEPSMDYEEIIKTAVPPLVYRSEEELKVLLSKGIFVDGGKTWLSLDKNGKHCEIISAAECLFPLYTVSPKDVAYYWPTYSRFPVDYDTVPFYDREDGWLMAELYQFTSDKKNVELQITFKCRYLLAVQGIEFQPLEKAEHAVLENVEVDMQTIPDADAYWEQKLPSDYKDIIKRSRDGVQWTTKKELYCILCKGFPVDGDEWVFLAENGKKCHMLSARVALTRWEWRWRSSPESRFKEVAFGGPGSFWISCSSDMLSPQTTYACYLVYMLEDNYSALHPPLKVYVNDYTGYSRYSWNTSLISHQTPIIRRKVYQNTHNPLSRPKMKSLPRLRKDGWMEVQIWEFQTGTTSGYLAERLYLTIYNNKWLEGLLVQGVEFKPT